MDAETLIHAMLLAAEACGGDEEAARAAVLACADEGEGDEEDAG